MLRCAPSLRGYLTLLLVLFCILDSGILTSGDASTLYGKIEFSASSSNFGQVGRAPLAALRIWQHRRYYFEFPAFTLKSSEEHPYPFWVRDALLLFLQILPLLPPRLFYHNRKVVRPGRVSFTQLFLGGNSESRGKTICAASRPNCRHMASTQSRRATCRGAMPPRTGLAVSLLK